MPTSGATTHRNNDLLTTAAKIALSKRYGFKKQIKLGGNKAGGAIRELRKESLSAAGAHRTPPPSGGIPILLTHRIYVWLVQNRPTR